MAAVAIRGTTYPVVLPKLRDPRLHLAATITSLQVLGQVAFHFRLSIAQILVCLGTCAVIEVAIAFRKQHVIMWPASALLTGNGVAFVLRLPGNVHGDWWSVRGWWIYALVAGGSLLSKHVVKWRGEHIFNPSNIGLVAIFLVLGRTRVEPLDFWWGPMSWWMALALAIIVAGGFAILRRLKLLRVALGFWAAFAVAVAVLALAGHTMTARWYLGPITGFHFWWVLVTSPEVLVFFFFMITDPKTAPVGGRDRVLYAVTLGILAGALIAPTTTEFAAKVALLGSLAVVCAAKPLVRLVPERRLALLAAPALALAAGVMLFANGPSPTFAAPALPTGKLPPIAILPSPGVATQLDRRTAEVIAHDLLAVRPAPAGATLRLHLEAGTDQGPPSAVAQLAGRTFRLHLGTSGIWTLAGAARPQRLEAVRTSRALRGERIGDVARSVGLDFRQGSFRFGSSNDYRAMMGGGVCFLDYNGDGWQDLFAVNSYASADVPQWQAHGGLPRTALFENDHGVFHDVTAKTHAGLQVQGDGCVAADLDGDGRTDLVVTTTSGVDVLWNRGGRFETAALPARGWYAGAAVADVNADGRPDLFVSGYSDPNEPVPSAIAGFPTNLTGVRDLLYLNEGGGRFREVGVQAGLESSAFRHGLGAMFLDYNGDGRPDLYVANDEDPNALYANVPWPGGAQADPAGLGFRFEDRGAVEGVADPFAGMGVAAANGHLFVSNSRHEASAAFSLHAGSFANARQAFDAALGTGFAGWGASFVDLANTGTLDLVLAAGAIPVTSLAKSAEPVRVLAPAKPGGFGNARDVLGPRGIRANGRGVAAADVDNDGRMAVAVNTIGGRLLLLRAAGPSGHWLDVSLSRLVPGAIVTAAVPGRHTLSRTVAAGSSYLSSEDPRVHFGLGGATTVSRLTVRYPWGAETTLRDLRADRIVEVVVPAFPAPRTLAAQSYRLAGCTPGAVHGSAATFWDETAARVLRSEPEPVQARDLFDISAAMQDAVAAGDAAVSYAAYRLLVWRASLGANLSASFAASTEALRSLCYSPGFTSTAGGSPAAVGNRVAAAAIAAGRSDGSNETIHYADPSYAPVNAPLIVSQPGSTAHDPTFWQPLALTVKAPQGVGEVPADVQTFVGAGWGHVRTYAGPVRVAPTTYGDASGSAYKAAAVAVVRATAGRGGTGLDGSPAAWNLRAAARAHGGLAADARRYLTLNGALNDAAVAVFGAKRSVQAPRPISMIRYLAFQGQSSDRSAGSYSADGLPLVPRLIELRGGRVVVRSRGRWVAGARWKPPVATPASPGGVSEASAFAYAAATVLGPAYWTEARRAAVSGLLRGIDTPTGIDAGRVVGAEAGRRALARR